MSVPGDRNLCGWRVRSDITLDELPHWEGDDRAPQIDVAVGAVPAGLADPSLHTPIMQIDAAGTARFHIAGVADYLVEDGRRITVAPALPVDAPDIRLFLLGMALGLLCHQRGVVPIHAAVVVVDGRAVLLAGASGSGKSTLAAGFVRRGFAILCDDVAPIDLSGNTAAILPGPSHLRLWRDTAQHAGRDPHALEPCRVGMEKYSVPMPFDGDRAASAPAMIVHLDRMSGDPAISITRLRGIDAMEALRTQIYRGESLPHIVGGRVALQRIAAAAAAIPRHALLSRPLSYEAVDAGVDAVLAAVRAAQ